MKHRFLVISIILIIGCSAESLSPQATFTFEATEENVVVAREELHEFAIENNLFFEDHSHKYPSGESTVLALAKRADGLELILTGGVKSGELTIAVHCHNKCKSWRSTYDNALERFQEKWKVTNG
jgi:hypothetical protein